MAKRTTALVKQDLALQVALMLENRPGMTLEDACNTIGISSRQYHRWIEENDGVLEQLRRALIGIKRTELQHVVAAREKVLAAVIADGISVLTDPEARLEILKYLVDRTDELIEQTSVGDKNATDFLTGPALSPAESTFSPTEVTITVKARPQTIIDVTPRDSEDS